MDEKTLIINISFLFSHLENGVAFYNQFAILQIIVRFL